MAAPVLQARSLRVAHPGQPPLFDGFTFDLPAGLTRLDLDVGKTTLLRLLAGELEGAGDFVLNGRAWRPADGRHDVAWVDPRHDAWDGCTPDEVKAAVQQRHPAFDEATWQQLVDAFDLTEHLHKTMHMLSTGSRRKVALAAALSAGAALTLLDEPTAGLDTPARDALAVALQDLAAQPRRAALLAAAWGLESQLPWAAVLEM